jgi:hypothetical protein
MLPALLSPVLYNSVPVQVQHLAVVKDYLCAVLSTSQTFLLILGALNFYLGSERMHFGEGQASGQKRTRRPLCRYLRWCRLRAGFDVCVCVCACARARVCVCVYSKKVRVLLSGYRFWHTQPRVHKLCKIESP